MTTNSRAIPAHFLDQDCPIHILMIGAGGNGSEFHDGLVRLHQGLIALGAAGLHVTVYDDDEVSPSNCVRQRFWPHEIGQNKAVAVTHRINMMMGSQWEGVPLRFTKESGIPHSTDLVVTAVDNKAARQLVYRALKSSYKKRLWLDMGCEGDKGQMILGDTKSNSLSDEWPNVVAHFPDLLSADQPKANRSSCSASDSLSRQDLMINQTVAGAGINLLWKMLRTGKASYNGVMIDLADGAQRPIPFLPRSTQ